ncbi:MAG: hypothetical protein CSB47_02625 [Proteobacteria bacterium]|nr:MAG: hypothetical protein CSB47_02625 [Pseudomonadota bacterium]
MQSNWQHAINQALGKNYLWEWFAKGSSNTLYRGCDGEHCIVLRKNVPAERTPGVDRQREALLLELISGHDWAPHIIKNHVADAWCAMKLYQAIPNKPQLTPRQQKQLIQAIGQLQQITTTQLTDEQITQLTMDYDALWENVYRPQAQAKNDQTALRWIHDIKQGFDKLPPTTACLVHHDLHIGNLAQQNAPPTVTNDTQSNTLTILDWEYGGLGNPWLDAASLLSDCKISPAAIATLPAFQQHTAAEFHDGLKQAMHIKERLTKLWCWARGNT